MTNNATKTYQVTIIERALAFYEVEAENARAAAENWQDGEFDGRDDEALDTEGPSSVRERQPDGTWRKVPPSEWEAAPEIARFDAFEIERQLRAIPRVFAALQAFTEAEAIADECQEWKWEDLDHAFKLARGAVAEAEAAGITPAPGDIDIHALLAQRRQIAHIWSIEDVQHLRPDLDDDQAWEVLQNVDHDKDSEHGITWLTLEMAAGHLHGDAPETDAQGEA